MANILILDDDFEFAHGLQSLLESRNHDVTWCRSATEAYVVICDMTIDLVISDIFIYQDGKVTGDGGIKLIGQLRIPGVTPLHDYMNGLPVIAVSAATNRARDHYVLELAKTVGATVTISKPVSDGEWIELVTEHLANRAQ